jgi:regulator of cell morphogenesis and NO signaling
MSFDPNTSIASIVAARPETARIFQRHQLDFCCHGETPLGRACAERGLELAPLVAELKSASQGVEADAADARGLSVPALVARIVDRHHGYLRTALPFLAPLAAKVARAHLEHDPRVVEVNQTFTKLRAVLEPHLDQEERELFPLLMSRSGDAARIEQELTAMREEHLAVGAILAHLRELTDGYAVPAWACNTFRLMMGELEKLELDILRHVHLENHVLSPMVAARGSHE